MQSILLPRPQPRIPSLDPSVEVVPILAWGYNNPVLHANLIHAAPRKSHMKVPQ